MSKKYVFLEKQCECGCGELLGMIRSDKTKQAKFKSGHIKNKRETIFIDKKCKCGCGEIIGEWKCRPERKPPIYKQGHQYKNRQKSDKRINKKGYIVLYRHRKDGGPILEHRFVMEKYLGRRLLPNEDIHHINGDKQDNKIENLMVIDHSEHSLKHVNELSEKKRKLNNKQVEILFQSRSYGKTYKQLAGMFNCSEATIHNILKGKSKIYNMGYEQGKKEAEWIHANGGKRSDLC